MNGWEHYRQRGYSIAVAPGETAAEQPTVWLRHRRMRRLAWPPRPLAIPPRGCGPASSHLRSCARRRPHRHSSGIYNGSAGNDRWTPILTCDSPARLRRPDPPGRSASRLGELRQAGPESAGDARSSA